MYTFLSQCVKAVNQRELIPLINKIDSRLMREGLSDPTESMRARTPLPDILDDDKKI